MGKRKLIIPQTQFEYENKWAAERAAHERRMNEQIGKIKEILRSHGIQMSVSGCGCCDSPNVKFAYQGELLIDEGCVNFDTEEEEKATDG